MRQLTLDICPSNSPYYLRLAQAIKQCISSSQVTPGERLPTARALAHQLNINRHTVMRSYAELIAQGWVENKVRSHYAVSTHLPVEGSHLKASLEHTTEEAFDWQLKNVAAPSNFIKSTACYQYSFAGGQPDTALFPFDEYKNHINDALKRVRPEALHYGENQGDPHLVEQISIYLRRTRAIQNKEIMMTNGSQEALYLISQLLLTAKDTIAIENLGYPPAWQAFKSTGATLLSIQQDAMGICIEDLEQQLKKQKIKCLYLTPLHQYPSTVTLPLARRLKIYALAKQYNFFIIEDDYDHEFHYRCQPLAPLAANDPSQLIIYLSSFSKIMFPAARAGVLAAPASLLPHLIQLRTTINHKPAMLLQDALARWIASGGFERHIRRCTKTYAQRLENAHFQIEQALHQGIALDCNIPDGGMALWIETGVDSELLAQHLKERNIYLQHEAEFTHVQNISTPTHIRLGFASQSIDKFNQGFAIILEVISHLKKQKREAS